MTLRTNLAVLKKSRREPEAGDVFAMRIDPLGWFFGRVVRTDAQTSPFADGWKANLIYIFRFAHTKANPPDRLKIDDLLIPPILIADEPWLMGRFVHIENRSFKEDELVTRHCFESPIFGNPKYFDDNGKELPSKLSPCGFLALTTLHGLDNEISRAIGIPPARQDDDEGAEGAKASTSAEFAGECSVSLYVPTSADADVAAIEKQLEETLKAAKVGEWEGHGFDLEKKLFDVRFEGPSGIKLLMMLSKAIKKLRPPLPAGWYVTATPLPDGEEEHVNL
jgi:hypothetical protein